MASATQFVSTTTPAPNYSNMPSGEVKTANFAPPVIANKVPPPIQIARLGDQLVSLKFRSNPERTQFSMVHQCTTFKDTATFTCFIPCDQETPFDDTEVLLLVNQKVRIELIMNQLRGIWGTENVDRIISMGSRFTETSTW